MSQGKRSNKGYFDPGQRKAIAIWLVDRVKFMGLNLNSYAKEIDVFPATMYLVKNKASLGDISDDKWAELIVKAGIPYTNVSKYTRAAIIPGQIHDKARAMIREWHGRIHEELKDLATEVLVNNKRQPVDPKITKRILDKQKQELVLKKRDPGAKVVYKLAPIQVDRSGAEIKNKDTERLRASRSIWINIEYCPRCRSSHRGLQIKPVHLDPGLFDMTYFGECSRSKAPILIKLNLEII